MRSPVGRTRTVEPGAIPDYPIAYDAGKALHTAAKAKGEFGYGAQWAGQAAPLARAMPIPKYEPHKPPAPPKKDTKADKKSEKG